jgi:hypothetical protein
MRHLRSVNEILIEMGEPAALQRAAIIGEDFDKTGKAFERPFELAPLTSEQLDWFIDVERASQNGNSGSQSTIDGMYTRLLRSIQSSGEFSEGEKDRFVQLLKTIIDEGIDHFARFSKAKRALAGLRESDYLRVTAPPQRLVPPAPNSDLQMLVDAAYVVVIRSLEYVFRHGDRQRGALMEGARRAMFNMDDAARLLAGQGVGAMFDISGLQQGPALFGAAPSAAAAAAAAPETRAHAAAFAVGEPLRQAIARLAGGDEPGHLELARRLETRLDAMTVAFGAVANGQR